MQHDLIQLGDLCNEIYRYPTYYDIEYIEHGVPEVRGALINDDGTLNANPDDWRFISAKTSSKFPKTVLLEGDLVVSVRGTIGKIGLVSHQLSGANITANLIRISPDKTKIYERYLWRFMRSSQFKEALDRISSSTTIKTIKAPDLKSLKIPLPPLAEQKRIAAILDKAEALRSLRRQALEQLDAMAQSIFIEMFGDPATNPKGWTETTYLGEIADIVSGITKGRKLNGKATREVPYLAVINVQDKKLYLDVLKTIEANENEIKRYRLQKDDLLLTEGGDPDKLGRGTLWNAEISECIHQNHVFRVRIISTEIEPLFLNWLIGSQRGKKYFLKSAKQTTGIASINMTQLKGFPLLIPPIALQQEFARRVESIDQLKTTHRESLAQLDALFASLQHRAFRGEL